MRLLFWLTACVLMSSCVSPTLGAEKPNILLIVSDDQGYGDASCYWETELRTPVMDGVAAAGVRFTKFRVNPLCAPTRSSFIPSYSPENLR